MLRKHLQRLEQPLEDEDKPERALDMIPEETYTEEEEEEEEGAKGIYFLFRFSCS